MDGNKDEADRCIQIALRCVQAGDREKARKFLNKAEKLFPTERAKGEPSVPRLSSFSTTESRINPCTK